MAAASAKRAASAAGRGSCRSAATSERGAYGLALTRASSRDRTPSGSSSSAADEVSAADGATGGRERGRRAREEGHSDFAEGTFHTASMGHATLQDTLQA